MKWFIVFAIYCVVSATSALAQITVDVFLDQDHFLANEPIYARIRVANSSGQTLKLSKADDWLSVSVESRDNLAVNQIAELPTVDDFTLDSAFTAVRKIDLSQCFSIVKSGRYTITATVKVPKWTQRFVSNPKTFDISVGTRLAEATFGVPTPDGSASPDGPVTRKYILLGSQQLKENKLYMRMTDSNEARTYKVFSLGTMVSFSKPEYQLDKWSNLHVLFQTGPRGFSYSIINPEALLITRENYDYSSTRPVLTPNRDGKVSVVGGTRRALESDIPPPEPAAVSPEPVSLRAPSKPPSDAKSKRDAKSSRK